MGCVAFAFRQPPGWQIAAHVKGFTGGELAMQPIFTAIGGRINAGNCPEGELVVKFYLSLASA